MKAIKVIGHPVLLMSLFLLLIIEGDNFGGFYLLYLLLALPHGALYAVIAVAGLICIFIGYKTYRIRTHPIKPILYLLGVALMVLSLFIFFGKGNKNATFKELIPLASFVLFGISLIYFLINSFVMLLKTRTGDHQHFNVAP
jgi:hypothetical protein